MMPTSTHITTSGGLISAAFISRTGFTLEAEAYAQQEGIMYSSREEIEALARVVGELVW